MYEDGSAIVTKFILTNYFTTAIVSSFIISLKLFHNSNSWVHHLQSLVELNFPHYVPQLPAQHVHQGLLVAQTGEALLN